MAGRGTVTAWHVRTVTFSQSYEIHSISPGISYCNNEEKDFYLDLVFSSDFTISSRLRLKGLCMVATTDDWIVGCRAKHCCINHLHNHCSLKNIYKKKNMIGKNLSSKS
jgi:hypothetical protein